MPQPTYTNALFPVATAYQVRNETLEYGTYSLFDHDSKHIYAIPFMIAVVIWQQ